MKDVLTSSVLVLYLTVKSTNEDYLLEYKMRRACCSLSPRIPPSLTPNSANRKFSPQIFNVFLTAMKCPGGSPYTLAAARPLRRAPGTAPPRAGREGGGRAGGEGRRRCPPPLGRAAARPPPRQEAAAAAAAGSAGTGRGGGAGPGRAAAHRPGRCGEGQGPGPAPAGGRTPGSRR